METPKPSPDRILIVDDDAQLCALVSEYLTARNFCVKSEGDGARGLERAQQEVPSLLVLDVMLPSLDGWEVLRRLRAGSGLAARIPVVMLTAHGDEVDRIVGLELGADDYLPKPFNPRELLARIQAILRRVALERESAPVTSHQNSVAASQALVPQTPSTPTTVAQTTVSPPMTASVLRVGDVEIDNGAREVWRAGQVVELTATEFDLLAVLMSAAGQVVSREELAQKALHRTLLPFDRSLDMHISKLRRKLEHNPNRPASDQNTEEYIKTVRGIGYIFVRSDKGSHA